MTNEGLSAKVAEARGDILECCGFEKGCQPPHDCDICLKPKPYATDMNCAWELVEEMQAKPYRKVCLESTDGLCDVYLHNHPIAGSSSTMPRAICKAYLKWKGVD